MTEGYLSNSCSSECYFEYKMDRVIGDKSIEKPKLYFERDYFQPSMPYTLFAVPQEWLEVEGTSNENATIEDFSYLPYDCVDIVYDVAGLECDPLTDISSPEYRDVEIRDLKAGKSILNFYKEQCRINITSQNSPLSGVGVINMLKNGTDSKGKPEKKLVARFFFVVNFSFKTKIHYKLSYVGSRVTVNFECKQRPQNIRVRLTYGEGRIPCLNKETSNSVDEFTLDFTKSKFTYTKDVGTRYGPNTVFSLTILGEEAPKYYMLHCDKNDTVKLNSQKPKNHPIVYSCPYCHQKIDNKIYSSARYRKGGISCTYFQQNTTLPTILDSDGNKMRNSIFCARDQMEDGSLDGNFTRLLPKNFMEHDSFKIAFLGSKRAGKTTFVSRFFDVSGDDFKAQMDMTMIHNGLAEIGVNVNAAMIQNIPGIDDMVYQFDMANWITRQEYYTSREIDLINGRYPDPTTTGDANYGRFPFVAEINRDVYVSFYDVAGEDSMDKQMVSTIAGGENEYLGVFLIVSGTMDRQGCKAVYDQLRESRIHKDSPIAVIVTKFDTLIDQFDPSCHCTRTDYFDGTRIYQDSYLQHEIDYSSEEIRSYLASVGLNSDLDTEYNNVKYFSVSSFNFKESIHHDGEVLERAGKPRFGCSASRMELPFIWMLNQFGVIK